MRTCAPAVIPRFLDGVSLSTMAIKNVVLCVAHYFMQSSSHVMIKRVLLSQYTPDQLSEAKEALWKDADKAVLGKLQNRRGSLLRSKSEVVVDDIVEAMVKLDEVNKTPEFIMSSMDIPHIPRIHPEESNNMYMVERMNALEKRMDELQDKFTNPSYSRVLMQSHAPSLFTDSEFPSIPTVASSSGELRMTRPSEERERTVPKQVVGGNETARSSKEGHSGPSSFTLYQSRKTKRKLLAAAAKKVSNIVGKGKEDSELKARPNVGHIFVHNLDRYCSETTVEGFLTRKEVKAVDIKKTSKSEWLSASFKVIVKDTDKDKTLKEGFWPPGVRCREWIPVRNVKPKPPQTAKVTNNDDADESDTSEEDTPEGLPDDSTPDNQHGGGK